jgi:ABC-type phosphate/phosphonate transport system permease subunit
MLTLTILLAMVAVPLGLSIAWALAFLIAGAGTAHRWVPARVARRPAWAPVRRR